VSTVADVLRVLGAQPDPAGAGDTAAPVTAPTSLGAAGPGAVTFCTARHAQDLRDSDAAVVIVDAEVADGLAGARPVLVRSANARLDFIRVVAALFAPPPPGAGVHPAAHVDPAARLGPRVSIGAGCTVAGEVQLGEDVVLHPGVHVARGTRVGPRVVVHSGTVIGADGYGFERDEAGTLVRFPHVGGVVIEHDAEIGANVCIDRGALDDTWIGPRARVDNLVHVAHNVRIGADAAVIALAMLGGSVVIGERAWIAPGAVLRDGIAIGDGAMVGLGAVVTGNVAAGETVLGNPARDLATQKAIQARLKALP
jgi:UDP-3-O-[3-hydroxymyristoyl] glucosamine N-acyltransferase